VSEANVEIARQGYAAVERGDFDAIRDFLDPNVKWHGGDESTPGACHNSDDVLEFMHQAHRRGSVGQLVDVIDAGEQVVVVLRPPYLEGKDPELRANLTTFRGGKVVEMVAYNSPQEALAATRIGND
jgi:ketosteroid isomerase-like protein